MNIRVHSADVNRVMKTIGKCIDDKRISNKNSCVQISHSDNLLTFHGRNTGVDAVMSVPVMGGDGEAFCVDGETFAKVAAANSGEMAIRTDGKTCTVTGNGKTRLPIVDVYMHEYEPVEGDTIEVRAEEFRRALGKTMYAVATDETRKLLTGMLIEEVDGRLQMVALDGYQMGIERIRYSGDYGFTAIIPGTFLGLLSGAIQGEDKLRLTTNGEQVQAETDSMRMRAGLLIGKYVDYERILPKNDGMEVLAKPAQILEALKASNVTGNPQNLVRLQIGKDTLTLTNNGPAAEYSADISCENPAGEDLSVAFNAAYLRNALAMIDTEEAVLTFNKSVGPLIVKGYEQHRVTDGLHMTLPVRVIV